MNVSLTPELEQFIAELVDSGRYRSASEVVRAAVRLLQDQETEREMRLEGLKREVGEGLAELDRGEESSADGVFEEILEALRKTEAV